MKVRQAELSPTERFRLNVHWSLVLNNWAAMFEEVDSGPLVEGDLPLGSWRTTLQANPDLRERLKDTRADYSADFLELIEENLLAEPTR